MRKIFIILPFLLCSFGFAMDPPAIVWAKSFFSEGAASFYDVHETADKGYIVAGFSNPGGSSPLYCLFRFSSDGVLEWATTPVGYSTHITFWAEELADGAFIAVGRGRTASTPTKGVMLLKVDSEGDEIWSKLFDFPGTNDQGNCVLPLEDGFAIAGDQGDKAWVIRTDLQGDSLWSATYEKSGFVNARRILQVDNTLIVFYTGLQVGILAYSIDDGQLLWEADSFPAGFGSVHDDNGDMTHSSSDNGFIFVTGYWPEIAQTDSIGNLLWYYEIPSSSQPYGYSVNNTMDSGYIYCGENTPDPDIPGSQYSGMVVKYNSEGTWQWRDYVYECNHLYSIRQLTSGGYIACGRGDQGVLIRYEPETGIEEEEHLSSSLITELSPNPFASTLNIEFNLTELSEIDLSVFDLSGRLIDELEQGSFAAGEHSSSWTPDGISSGCYLVRLSTPEGSYAENCVFIP